MQHIDQTDDQGLPHTVLVFIRMEVHQNLADGLVDGTIYHKMEGLAQSFVAPNRAEAIRQAEEFLRNATPCLNKPQISLTST